MGPNYSQQVRYNYVQLALSKVERERKRQINTGIKSATINIKLLTWR